MKSKLNLPRFLHNCPNQNQSKFPKGSPLGKVKSPPQHLWPLCRTSGEIQTKQNKPPQFLKLPNKQVLLVQFFPGRLGALILLDIFLWKIDPVVNFGITFCRSDFIGTMPKSTTGLTKNGFRIK